MTKYIIAHDLGTSGNKATLFTTDGKLVKSSVFQYGTKLFNSNWAEQNPNDWWKAFCSTNKELLEGIDKTMVSAVSFSGQMMGCLCVDKNGNPLRNSIIWMDMRAQAEQLEIEEKIDKREFYNLTGHRISSAYSVEKLMWIKNNEPDIYHNTYKILNAKDYIVCRLTGKFVTDYSDASGTNVFDINTFKWSDRLVNITGIDRDKLPEALPSTTIVGEVSAAMSEECGLPIGTKVVLGGGDGMCASVGAGSVTPNFVYNCLGSSSWITTTTEKPIFDEEMKTFNWAHVVPGMIGPTGTMQAAGLSYNWAINMLYKKEIELAGNTGSVYELVNSEITKSQPLSNNLLFLPYLVGERSPRWNPNARGAFIGLTAEHTRGDLMRSVVEGVAMNLRIILDSFRNRIPINEITVIGGLAKSPIVRQILADVFDAKILKLNCVEEATSIGAVVTAGVSTGEIKDFSEVSKFITVESIDVPNKLHTATYNEKIELFNIAYDNLRFVNDKLSMLRN